MKLIVGLGNPGKEYIGTRHNTGRAIIDHFSLTIEDKNVKLLKPDSFMNESGKAVVKAANFYKIKPEDILVIHDDLDIPLGYSKLQKGVGPKGHNGVLSVEESLGTKDFWRLRVGIENREQVASGDEFVLGKFTKDELAEIEKATPKLLAKIKGWLGPRCGVTTKSPDLLPLP